MSVWQWLGAALFLGGLRSIVRAVSRHLRGPLPGVPYNTDVERDTVLAIRFKQYDTTRLRAMTSDTSLSEASRRAAALELRQRE